MKAFLRVNWRSRLGDFVVVLLPGILVALRVDQIRTARADAALQVEYLESLLTDLEADLAQ